ncbi:MAG TPA: hypothetical protein VJV23_05635 [Candidatus Polarisedimenticolia bacterium]|nr:hypothetical protein [Candidatus Polarisedimenticolia bacterium]
MSFCRSERGRAGRGAALLRAAAIGLVLAAPAAGTEAKEATNRGAKATITWMDETGERRQVAEARDIRYGYYIRAHLSVPKDGRTFRDDLKETKAIPFFKNAVKFSVTDRITFERVEDAATGRSRLTVTIRKANGRMVTGIGEELAGAQHPLSPFIAFRAGAEERAIDLDPITPEAKRRGKPRLLEIQFTL